jgi:iron-sulfur cluster assembly protein
MPTVTEPMVSVTEAAVNQLKEILAKKGNPDLGLRIAVYPGGCSGFQYYMALDDSQNDDDLVFEVSGIKVFVDELSSTFLEGSQVDYVDTLMGGGFAVQNPNAVSSCGCGHSFRTANDGGNSQRCH